MNKKETDTIRQITIKEYAKIAGVSAPAIGYRMKKKRRLPGIVSYRYDIENKEYLLQYDGSNIKGLFRQKVR